MSSRVREELALDYVYSKFVVGQRFSAALAFIPVGTNYFLRRFEIET